MTKYKVGSIINCQVTGVEKYGIFVKIDEEYTGLIHISEISEGFVRNVLDYASVGEKIYAKIIYVDEEDCKLKLSIKNIDYKNNIDYSEIMDSEKGFAPLKEHLDSWIDEKLKEIKERY